MAKSEQKSVNDISGVSPNTSQSLQETLRVDGSFPVGSQLQDMLASALGVNPPTSKSVQELLYDNLKDELSLTGPYTAHSEQSMLEQAETAGLTISQILGNVAGSSFLLQEDGTSYILQEDGTSKIIIE